MHFWYEDYKEKNVHKRVAARLNQGGSTQMQSENLLKI